MWMTEFMNRDGVARDSEGFFDSEQEAHEYGMETLRIASEIPRDLGWIAGYRTVSVPDDEYHSEIDINR